MPPAPETIGATEKGMERINTTDLEEVQDYSTLSCHFSYHFAFSKSL